jgi:hypothetical protein
VTPTAVALIVFACALGGALAGMRLRAILPEHHLTADSKDTVKLGVGLVATMTALVLGLVTASAKGSFDALDTAIKHAAQDVLTLDRALARYGPETGDIRTALKGTLGHRLDMVWPRDSSAEVRLDPSSVMREGEGAVDRIRALSPRNEAQQALKARSLELGEEILEARWLLSGGVSNSVPVPFLVVLTFWLTITFVSFGLFAPRNATVIAVLLVCALSVGGAVFLILEMDSPFTGLIKVSGAPLRFAYDHMNM